jgi:REP element-mobilizing transposase RayT
MLQNKISQVLTISSRQEKNLHEIKKDRLWKQDFFIQHVIYNVKNAIKTETSN